MLLLAALVLMQDPAVTGYLEGLCGRLSSRAEVSVSVESAARAAALPEGGIRVTTGMIAGALNEAELAGILAHELAHTRMARDSRPGDPDAESGWCFRFARSEPKFAEAKKWEHDADQAAIVLLTKAGYDPLAMLRYFARLRHASTELPRAFSAEDVLIERLQLEATDHPMKDPILDTAEFRAVRDRVK
jgi:predicted Zn-dependent protease